MSQCSIWLWAKKRERIWTIPFHPGQYWIARIFHFRKQLQAVLLNFITFFDIIRVECSGPCFLPLIYLRMHKFWYVFCDFCSVNLGHWLRDKPITFATEINLYINNTAVAKILLVSICIFLNLGHGLKSSLKYCFFFYKKRKDIE